MIKRVFILFSVLVVWSKILAQYATFIEREFPIYIHDNDSLAFFGDVLNNGNLSLASKSNLFFYGKRFVHYSTAIITDSSATVNSSRGGVVQFIQPNMLYGDMGRQIIEASGSPSSYQVPSLLLKNVHGVSLSTSVHVLNHLNLVNGSVFLNTHDLVIGDSVGNGKISNYNVRNYIVHNQDWNRGFLKINNQSLDSITFPIGTAMSYLPLRIKNISKPGQSFYAKTVALSMSGGSSGRSNQDSTTGNTWIIGIDHIKENVSFKLYAEHGFSDEGKVFQSYRSNSYLSEFRHDWAKPSLVSYPATPGFITSGGEFDYNRYYHSKHLNLSTDQSLLLLQKRILTKASLIRVPNSFSPNGDMINDEWVIPDLKLYPNCSVQVFNRYGQIIFQSKGYEKPWNGTYARKVLPVGTYYYIIKLSDNLDPVSGYITILK